MGPGAPASRIWNAKCYACKDIPGYCVSLGMSVSYGRSPFRNQPCGHSRCTIPAGHSPAPVPVRSLRTCSQLLSPANGRTGRMTLDHLPNLLSFLFAAFPPKRCETISPWPHLLSVTSCQLGGKLICVHPIIPDNLSGISVVGLPMKNVRQLGAHFNFRSRADNSCQLGTNF